MPIDLPRIAAMTRRKKALLISLIAVPLIWLLGDFIYSRVILWRMARWESQIERDADGLREGTREYTVGDGEHAILLIHGINDTPYSYRKMAPRLAEQGFTCRVMRLPGFGLPAPEYAETSAEEWLQAVDAEVEALRKSHAHVSLIAHSLGGAVAIAYLREHPEKVESAALLAPAVEVSSDRSPLLPTRAWHRVGNALLLFTRITESPFPIDVHDPGELGKSKRMPFVPRRLFDETYKLLDRNRGHFEEFRTPLLVAVSQEDHVIDFAAVEEFYESASSPVKEFHLREDAGHELPVDYGWQELTDKIAQFFRLVAEESDKAALE